MALYDAYDKHSDKQGLGWADQWDYKYNDKYGSEDSHDNKGAASNKEKMAKVKSAASAGMDKTKSVMSSGAHKVASGTTSGFKWIKEKVQKKPQ